jgi:hypothetical protein
MRVAGLALLVLSCLLAAHAHERDYVSELSMKRQQVLLRVAQSVFVDVFCSKLPNSAFYTASHLAIHSLAV